MNALVRMLVACIPAGIVLAILLEDARWLWLCAPIFIFLS